jgi:hypothetical protein
MNFLLSLLLLLAYPQEALHKRHLVYCVRVMSVGCSACYVSWLQCVLCQLAAVRVMSADCTRIGVELAVSLY